MSEPLALPDAGNEEYVTRRKKKVSEAQQRRENAIKVVMATPEGRSVLWGIWTDGRTDETTHVPGDALSSAFNEGARCLALRSEKEVKALCPDLWFLAMTEASYKEKTNE